MTEREYFEAVNALYFRDDLDHDQQHEAEINLMIDFHLGNEIPEEKRSAIQHIRREWRKNHEALMVEADAGKHTRESLAEAVYTLMCDMHRQLEGALDAKEYEKFLGTKAGKQPSRKDLGIDPSLIDWLPE